MILPVFSVYASQLAGATPVLVGIALGIYGLTQCVFQIPFGFLSDYVGRKKIIAFGLIIFAIGSAIAALSDTISWIILGRALQGTGAIGSTIMALMSDLTSAAERTKAMAIAGITIGLSFSLAMLIGPLLTIGLSTQGLFWVAVFLSGVAMVILITLVPNCERDRAARNNENNIFTLLKNPTLIHLNISILLLHAIFTASFVVLPMSLQSLLPSSQQWKLYLPVLLIAFSFTLPLIIFAEKKQCVKLFFISAIFILGFSEILFWFFSKNFLLSAVGLLLFFTAFSILEAFLPSLVSKIAPKNRKGTALGIYSSAQFLGIFLGGGLGGWLHGKFGLTHVYLFCVVLAFSWIMIAFQIKNPQHQSPENDTGDPSHG